MAHDKRDTAPPSRRRWIRRLIFVAALLFLLPLLAPYLAATDLARDRVLNAAIADSSLRIESQSASFGWLSPAAVHGVTIHSPDNRLLVEVDQLRSDRSWWRLWLSPDRLGHIDLIAPRAEIKLDWQDFEGYSAGSVPRFTAAIDDASLRVKLKRMEEPVIDLNSFDLALRVEETDTGDYLVVDDAVVFNNRQINSETCSELLQLIDPTLGDVVQAEGEFTLQLDRLKLPLNVDVTQQQRCFSLAGRLELHRVTTEATTPLLRGVVRVAADMHDYPPSEIVRVVNQSAVEFEIREGRLYHEGLQFGLPDIDPELIVKSQGSVGLDETLDVHVTIPKLFLNERSDAESNSVDVAQLHITGTIAEPMVTRLDAQQENLANGLSQR